MAEFIKGDVVVIPFPFSNFNEFKKRPALVLADAGGNDVILCQITSQTNKDKRAISLHEDDFEKGNLYKSSNIRPNKIFTVDKSIILFKIGALKGKKINAIIDEVIKILRQNRLL